MKQKWKVFLSLICALVMSCSILAACDNGGETQSEVTVTLSEETLTLDLYEPATLEATVTGTDEDPVWSSSNEAVATVSETGEIVGLSNGQATITATVGDVSDSCAVTVQSTGATPMITGLPTQVTMAVDDTRTLTPAAEYKGNALSLTYAYESSDTAVASVTSAGVITAEGRGTATVSVTASYYTFNLEEEIEVTVTDNVSIALDADSLSLNVNDTRQLKATITVNGEAYTSTEGIAWSSSDSDAVEVSAAGLVTAKAETQMPVTVTLTFTYEGQPFTADCTVSVARETVDLTDEAVTEIEIYADAEADTVTLPLSMIPSSYAVTAADVTSVRDTAYNAAIPFENDGGTLELVKFTGDSTVGNIYSGETTYEIGTAEYVFEIPVLMISKVLKTADDIDDMQDYCMMDPATVYSPSDKQFYYVAYFTLGDDIDYGGKTIGDWSDYDSIGGVTNGSNGFAGTVDGRNHTISNMAVDNNNNGFIGTLALGGELKNIAFLNARLMRGPCAVAVGLIAGGTVDNVIVHGTRTAGAPSWAPSGMLAVKTTASGASISNVLVFSEDFDYAGNADSYVIVGRNDSNASIPMTNVYAVCNTETTKLWCTSQGVTSGFVATAATSVGELLAVEGEGAYDASGFVGWDSTTSEKYGIALPATFDESSATDANFLYSVRITNTVLNAYPSPVTTVSVANLSDNAVTYSLKEAVTGVSIDSSTGVITVDASQVTSGAAFTVVASVGEGKYQSFEATFTAWNRMYVEGTLNVEIGSGTSDAAAIDVAQFPTSYEGFSFDDILENGILNNDTQTAVEFEVSSGELFLKGLTAGEYSLTVSTDDADFVLTVYMATLLIENAQDMMTFDRLIYTEGTSIDDPLTGYYLMLGDVDMAYTGYVFGDNQGEYSINGGTAYAFGGTFNGNGYALKNALIGNRGLFWEIAESGVVKNLAIIDAYALGWKAGDEVQYEAETRVNNGATVIADMHYGLIENVFIGGKMGHGHWNFDGLFGQNRGDMVNVIVDIFYDTTDGTSDPPGDGAGASSVTSLIGFNGGTYTNVIFVTNTQYIWADGNGTPQTSVPSGITVYSTGAAAVAAIDLSATSFDSAYWTENAEGILYGGELVVSARLRIVDETFVDLSTANDDGAVALDLSNITKRDSAFTADAVTDVYLYNGAEAGADIAHSVSEGSLLLSGLATGRYDIVIATATAEYRVPVFVVTMVIDSEEDLIALETAINATTEDEPLTGYYLLTADITLTEESHIFGYDPTKNAGYFAGTFDGQGYAIKGMVTGERGLFNNVSASGVIKNVAFIDAYAMTKGETVNGTVADIRNNSVIISFWFNGTMENVFVSGTVGRGPWNFSGVVGRWQAATVNNCIFDVEQSSYTYTENASMTSTLGYVSGSSVWTDVIIITSSNEVYCPSDDGTKNNTAPSNATLYTTGALASRAEDLANFSSRYWSKNADGAFLFGDEVVVAGPEVVTAVVDTAIDLSAAAENMVALDIAAILEEDPDFDINDIVGITYYGGGDIAYSVSDGSLLLEDGIDAGEYDIVIMTSTKNYRVSVTVATTIIDTPDELTAFDTLIKTQGTAQNSVAGYYLLGADIDMAESEYVFGDLAGAYEDGTARYFGGTFDGNGYAIKNATVGNKGLFWYITDSGIVKNLALIDATALGCFKDGTQSQQNVTSSNLFADWNLGLIENVYIGGEVGYGWTSYSGVFGQNRGRLVNVVLDITVNETKDPGAYTYLSALGYSDPSATYTNVILITSYANVAYAASAPMAAPAGVTVYQVASVAAAAEDFDFGSFSKGEDGAVSFGDEVIIAAVPTTTVSTATEVDPTAAVDGEVEFDVAAITAVDDTFDVNNVVGVAYAAGGSIGFSVSEDTLYLSSSLTGGSYNIIVCTAEKNYLVAVSVVTVIDSEADLIALEDAIFASEGSDPVSGYYVLGADIDLSESTHVFGGTVKGGNFAGTFDGRGHSIIGMTTGDRGLFNTIAEGGVIENVAFIDAYSATHQLDGGNTPNGSKVIAHYSYGTLDNVFVSASVGWGPWDYSGIIGRNYGTISNSVFVAEARNDGTDNANWNTNGSVLGYVDGTASFDNVILVTASTNVYRTGGGQQSTAPTGVTLYADADSAVAAEDFTFGSFTKDSRSNVLFNGKVVIEIVGRVNVSDTTLVNPSVVVDGKTELDLSYILDADEAFSVTDVQDVTDAEGNNIDFTVSDGKLYIDAAVESGEYTIILLTEEKDYYVPVSVATVISDLEDLQAFDAAINAATSANPLKGYYVLSADIVVPDDSDFIMGNYISGNGYWNAAYEDVFAGIFDGMGYTISGLKVGDSGIFGNVVGGTIRNVALVDIYAMGNNEDGVTVSLGSNLLCHFLDGAVENVFISGSIPGGGNWYTGIVHDAQATATFKNCVFDIEVRGMQVDYSTVMGLLRTSSFTDVVLITNGTQIYDNKDAADQTTAPAGVDLYADVAAAVAGEEFGFGSFTKDGSGNILFNGEVVVAAEVTE
ncbi:MAG TPA: Ig-like domain-containing protein [Candidatus Borkfalkia avicola]|uniref:Ig-like domain-containing protein n=1 Tax=Candidatus Borkfalkia avicola TaxID=2838503 RepID=A0A9D2D7V1_9FIRM|nr:Ig-like domain-containing protein [Candidatus Borkfalkia avicola]